MLLTAKLLKITDFRVTCSLLWIPQRLADSCWRRVWYILSWKWMQQISQKRWWSTARACMPALPQTTTICFLPSWLHLCRFCLHLRWVVSGGNLSSLEWFPHATCTDAAVGVSSLLWCPYVVSSYIMCQKTGDPPWAGPLSLQMILNQQKVLWQPLCVADCFFHIVQSSLLSV